MIMAYTFDEIFANQPPTDPNEYDEVLTTVVITQEDGRTAYGSHWFTIDYPSQVLRIGINNADPAFDFYMVFSDRNRFTGQADRLGVQISRLSASMIRVAYILKSWGNVQNSVDAELPANYSIVGKLYQGWGDTIGHGTGRALNCISFNSLRRSRIIPL
jgi:hypothetical protein